MSLKRFFTPTILLVLFFNFLLSLQAAAAGPSLPSLGPCASAPEQSCASFSTLSGSKNEIWLSGDTLNLLDTGTMGQFPNGSNFSYIFARGTGKGTADRVVLYIFNLANGTMTASFAPPDPYTISNTYFGVVGGPGGEKYPFLAPGAFYMNVPHRNYLCIFDPAYIGKPSQSCSPGFKPFSISFNLPDGTSVDASGSYRHNGGWIEDMDADGYGDIHIPYLAGILTISGRTGEKLGLSHFDVAQIPEPNSPAYFHSGRLYGGFTSFNNLSSGTKSVLLADGNAVGTFSDFYCNVSRYFAVAKWQPGGYQLVWSDYLSFSKTIFNPPYNSITNYSRLGNDLNKCAHRFSDSIVQTKSGKMVMFNLFTKQDPNPICQAELLAEQKSSFGGAEVAAYDKCAADNITFVNGSWTTVMDDLLTGARLASIPNSYVWGKATNVLPSVSNTLLVQNFSKNGGVIRFDQTANNIESLTIAEPIGSSGFSKLATLTSPPAPPKLTHPTNTGEKHGSYPIGIGTSWGGVPELTLKDIDGDGLNDIQLNNDAWIGYSAATGNLVLKMPGIVPPPIPTPIPAPAPIPAPIPTPKPPQSIIPTGPIKRPLALPIGTD